MCFKNGPRKKRTYKGTNKTHSEFAEMLLQYFDQEKETGTVYIQSCKLIRI